MTPDPPLGDYQAKRDFDRTPEPSGGGRRRGRAGTGPPRFVVQEHHATALHWDLRLERDGVLVSWAVPKGIPPDPRTNHLAVRTEDHPLEYLDFQGDIPTGEYGAGRMSVWDRGVFEVLKWSDREVQVIFHGEKVQGRYALVRHRGPAGERLDDPPDGPACGPGSAALAER